MTAIRNSVYFLRKHFITDSKALHHLEVIDDELSQSDEVIERLLELTKGKKIKLKTTDLRKIAHDAYLICTPPRNIQLKIKLEEATKEIRLDPLLFRQILTWGSIRKAELLSITTQPCLRASSAYLIEMSEPELKMAISSPLNESALVSMIFSRFPHASISRPADLEEASNLASATGNSLFSSR
jgi:hypothetical protein